MNDKLSGGGCVGTLGASPSAGALCSLSAGTDALRQSPVHPAWGGGGVGGTHTGAAENQ